ncbi:hypothetical protein [Rhizobium lusitanum]|nr:hypothetical protein [Rhizobium lusitanum]MBM7046439.1 hypothetical protein [Rhizobium lusitanum]
MLIKKLRATPRAKGAITEIVAATVGGCVVLSAGTRLIGERIERTRE